MAASARRLPRGVLGGAQGLRQHGEADVAVRRRVALLACESKVVTFAGRAADEVAARARPKATWRDRRGLPVRWCASRLVAPPRWGSSGLSPLPNTPAPPPLQSEARRYGFGVLEPRGLRPGRVVSCRIAAERRSAKWCHLARGGAADRREDWDAATLTHKSLRFAETPHPRESHEYCVKPRKKAAFRLTLAP